ncbi:MAG: cyclic nucleotide-binding domain-containing protein [Gammaproteobacteria bacterium]|nr:MAG: cyclic nucleotide-binding domain-containing protein [Gammaproteobacteria bacterium]
MSTQAEEGIAIQTGDQLIKASPLGAELSDAQVDTLAKLIKVTSLKDGEFLLQEGHADDVLYVIASGKLEVCKDVGGGEHITLQVLHAGDMAGELGFIDGHKHSAGLRAIGECSVFGLLRSDLEGLLKTDGELVYKVMRAIIRTVHRILRQMNIQYAEMQNYIAKQHGRY